MQNWIANTPQGWKNAPEDGWNNNTGCVKYIEVLRNIWLDCCVQECMAYGEQN